MGILESVKMNDEVNIWTYFSKSEGLNTLVQCCICGKCFNSEKHDLQNHLKSSHSDVIVNQIVNQIVISKRAQNRHVEPSFSEKEGTKSFVWNHFSKTLDKDNKCLHCEIIIPNQNGGTTPLRDHMILHHRNQITQEEKRYEKEKNNIDIDAIKEGERRSKEHSCHHCGKLFDRKAYLIRHINAHEKNYTLFCSYENCRKGFVMTSQLKRHERVHTGEKPYQCATCGRDFRNLTHLTTHTRVHTGETPYQCFKCNKKFKFLASRNSHKCGVPLILSDNSM